MTNNSDMLQGDNMPDLHEKTKDEMQDMLSLMLDEDKPYQQRLDAYEYL